MIRHGVLFNHHPGRYRLRIVDAMCPEKELPTRDVAFVDHPRKDRPFRAVFLNYLLDCLPAAVLQFDGDQVKELHVRTCVARNVKLEDFTDLTVEHLREQAKSSDPRSRQELLEVYGLFASEYDYRPVDVSKIPYGQIAADFARSTSKRVLLSYGAIQCLERLLELIADDGFILVNDYGQTMTTREDEFEHQRFSLATFVGLNFPLLKKHFDQAGRSDWIEPQSEAGGIHSRLVCRTRVNAVVVKFWEPLQQERLREIAGAGATWRACARRRAVRVGGEFLQRSVGDPAVRNWVLMNGEVSRVLDILSLRDGKAGIDMAKIALELESDLLGGAVEHAGRRPVRVWPHRGSRVRPTSRPFTSMKATWQPAFQFVLCYVHAKN